MEFRNIDKLEAQLEEILKEGISHRTEPLLEEIERTIYETGWREDIEISHFDTKTGHTETIIFNFYIKYKGNEYSLSDWDSFKADKSDEEIEEIYDEIEYVVEFR